MYIEDLLKTATTDSLYTLLATVLTTLRTRGDITIAGGRIDTDHATIDLDGDSDDFTYVVAYYSEVDAEIAVREYGNRGAA